MMINTTNFKISKNMLNNVNTKIYENPDLKKKMDDEYKKYVCNSILEAEECLLKSEKTYTYEEWIELNKKWDESIK